jgi:hypothetical protein
MSASGLVVVLIGHVIQEKVRVDFKRNMCLSTLLEVQFEVRVVGILQ